MQARALAAANDELTARLAKVDARSVSLPQQPLPPPPASIFEGHLRKPAFQKETAVPAASTGIEELGQGVPLHRYIYLIT